MRLFGKKSSTPAAPSGSAEAEAEAEAELRRAVEALGMPTAGDDAPSASEPPPAAVDLSVEEEPDDAVPLPGEADVPGEEAQHAGSAGSDDRFPDESPAGEPARRRVRKTPPGATQPARRSAAGGAAPRPRTSAPTQGASRQRRTST